MRVHNYVILRLFCDCELSDKVKIYEWLIVAITKYYLLLYSMYSFYCNFFLFFEIIMKIHIQTVYNSHLSVHVLRCYMPLSNEHFILYIAVFNNIIHRRFNTLRKCSPYIFQVFDIIISNGEDV